jgi:molybdopterin biosynthesis enzyme
VVTSREIGMLAAAGLAELPVVRRPRVAVISTGDELHPPGTPLPPGGIIDSNAAILCAAVAEAGGEPVPMGIFRDEEPALSAALRDALGRADLVVMSGGTSKGAGDVSHRVLGAPRAARDRGAWRRAEAGQAALPGGRRAHTGRRAAGLPDQRGLHLPRIRRARDPAPWPACRRGRRRSWPRRSRCARRASSGGRNT